MDGNRLKHNFIKKKDLDSAAIETWIDGARRYAQSHTPYPMWNNTEVQYNNPSITTIQISRSFSTNRARQSRLQEIDGLENVVKQEMLKEISQILLDNGFIQTIQTDDYVDYTTKLIMKIKAKKLIQ